MLFSIHSVTRARVIETHQKPSEAFMAYRAEYIWIDGQKPTAKLRSKTKIVPSGEQPPLWGFDGSSTEQAPGNLSDCVLNPVFVRPDPIRGGDDVLVMCEVLTTDMEPHPSNTRAAAVDAYEKYKDQDPWFGLEQEYTFFKDGRPHGWPVGGYPAPQGGYYCGVGADEIWGRDVVEDHTAACLEAGIAISGTNAEVMIGQWEFQIGPLGPVEVGDHLWMARWLLYRIAEDYNISAHLNPKPVEGDWNGAGMHTNFSTIAMRESYEPIIAACEALGANPDEHIKVYGAGIERRLTGLHETAPWTEYSYGVSDRGASVRIPWQTAREGKGYLEDRRPNANADPYTVAAKITNTVCGALAE
jgi:glutamine synthetase